jgi:hypothetical protein
MNRYEWPYIKDFFLGSINLTNGTQHEILFLRTCVLNQYRIKEIISKVAEATDFYSLKRDSIILSIFRIGSFNFGESHTIYPSYVSEKLNVCNDTAEIYADFLNAQLTIIPKNGIFGKYREKFMLTEEQKKEYGYNEFNFIQPELITVTI